MSSHYVIDRDGTIYATVREQDTAWVNGVVEHANVGIPIVADWVANDINPNEETIGIEVAGYSSMQPSGQPPHLVGYTEDQFAALDYLLPVLRATAGTRQMGDRHRPRSVFGHCEISAPSASTAQDCLRESERVYGMAVPDPSDGPLARLTRRTMRAARSTSTTVVWAGKFAARATGTGRENPPVSEADGYRRYCPRIGGPPIGAAPGGVSAPPASILLHKYSITSRRRSR